MGELLDSGTLDGMLDTDVTSIVHPSRPDHRQPRSSSAQLLAQTYTLGLIYSLWLTPPPSCSCCLLDAVHTVQHTSPADFLHNTHSSPRSPPLYWEREQGSRICSTSFTFLFGLRL